MRDVKADFPILQRRVNGKRLVYLDSAATSQKPESVLLAMEEYYQRHNANVHRGTHTLGDEATEMLEKARDKVARFIGANEAREVVFVRNATEALNLVAYAWGLENLSEGDVVLTTEMEHHANIVPWQEIAKMRGARVEFVKITDEGELDLGDLKRKLSDRVKVVAFTQVSNTLGTVNPVAEIVRLVRKKVEYRAADRPRACAGPLWGRRNTHKRFARGVPPSRDILMVVDGAQAVPHMRVDVSKMGADFYAFSGHKMYGPMGIGVLWGKGEILERMRPFLMGGGMIDEVHKEGVSWAEVPEKFEAGTPNVAGAVGLAAAVDYLEELRMDWVERHGREMVEYALERLGELEKRGLIRIVGPKEVEKRIGSVSFTYNGVHAHDVATVLDSEGVAVRSGHHCTMVLHEVMGLAATVRASFGVYTTKEDIDVLVRGLEKVGRVFGC